MNVKEERVKRGWSQQELSDKSGIPRGRINGWEQRGTVPKTQDYNVLQEIFATNVPIMETNVMTEPTETYISKRRNLKNTYPAVMAPLVSIKAQAGYIRSFDQEVFMDTLEKYALPPGISHIGAIWRYFEVEGSSMEPTFYNGDVLLASQVPREDWDQLRNFYIYILVGQSNIWVKRVHQEANNTLILISDNDQDTAPFQIKIDDLLEIWVFRRHIKKTAPIAKTFDIDKIRKQLKS